MKKIIRVILILIFITVFISGCNKTNNKDSSIKFTFDTNGNYTGFSNIPDNYTIQDATEDGYLVMQDLDIIENQSAWDNFVELSSNKKYTSIRIVKFYTDSLNSPYFLDLFYNNGYYYCFDSSSETQEKKPFSLLKTLEGKFGNPLKDLSFIILTNDDELTFDMIINSRISSDLTVIKNISPFKIIMFK